MNIASKEPKTIRVKVVGNKRFQEGTIKVRYTELRYYPYYKKQIEYAKTYLVHWPEKKEIVLGTTVLIVSCRKHSKRKAFEIVRVLEKGEI